MAYRINDNVYIDDNKNNVMNDIVVKLEDDITEISTIKETESEINTKLDVIIDSIDELNTLNFNTSTCELSRESFIYSLSKLGYSYNEITISIEDWESFKDGTKTDITNILSDTLNAITRVMEKTFVDLINLTKTMFNYITDRTENILTIKKKLLSLDKNLEIFINKKTINYIKDKFPLFLNENNVFNIENILRTVSDTKQLDTLISNFNKLIKKYDNINYADILDGIENLDNGINKQSVKTKILNHPNINKFNNLLVLSIKGNIAETLVINENKKIPTLEITKNKIDVYVDNVELANFTTINDLINNINILIKYSGEFKIYTKKLGSYTKVFHEDSDILKRNLKNSIKETHTKIEQRNEINSIKVISHTLEILNKKMIATCVSNYFWNLRSCMRVIEFMSYQYVNKK